MAAGDATHAPPAAEAQSLVESFCAVTSATPDEATFFLEGHNWALEAVVRSFYDNTEVDADGPDPAPQPPPAAFIVTLSGSNRLCSVVLMYGLIIILSSAAKITHQAQALTGQTTKWHACCTIEPVPDDEIDPGSNQNSMLEEYPEDESDCESSEETGDEDMLENTKFLQPHTHVISFQKRQALGPK
ncbi:hypothetical protein TRIUR3_31091 [Triticum urartu]|uniref:Uncharacterized protein n=1 Tax=Triticum urartu TaxID=4572 RepID=M8A647_TRIUA|nr:hypothetical protein TRIUR3_31091 [Triticum urartu]